VSSISKLNIETGDVNTSVIHPNPKWIHPFVFFQQICFKKKKKKKKKQMMTICDEMSMRRLEWKEKDEDQIGKSGDKELDVGEDEGSLGMRMNGRKLP
jgi:hypothetical protein